MSDYSPGWAEFLSASTIGTHTESPPRWEDLRFPAQMINLTGSSAPPTVDNDPDYFPGTLLFSGSAENVIAGVAQLPHTWVEGSIVHPHIHWSKPVADASDLAVGWQFRYRLSNRGSSWTAWSTWGDHTLIQGDNTSAELHNLSVFPYITMTGYTVSCFVAWMLRRAGNTDAYNGIARLYEYDIHYMLDALGSTTESVK